MITYAKGGGCGCGGGSAAAGATHAATGGCGCGCEGGCEACGSDAYVRPRFFAGQLLTEEDLDLLTGYVTSKNRLHNRSFFGEGVVCGLEVGCDPCGGGRVVVRPGYALDCCGNDIVVPCAQELDVNALVHKLRVETLGGYDCGDPCADTTATTTANGSSDAGDDTGAKIIRAKGEEVEVRPARRRYSLYVRYCEESTDPVAPYATDEPCGAQGCEPTRIREGFRFELRCEAKPRRPDDFLTRLVHCVADVRDLGRLAGRTRMWQQLAGPIPTALRVHSGQERPEFVAADAEAMKASVANLQKLQQRAPAKPTPDQVRSHLDDVRTVVIGTATLNTLDPAARKRAIEKFKLGDVVEAAPDAARAAAERLEPELHRIDDPFEQRAARALLTDGVRWTDPTLGAEERSSVQNALAMSGIVLDAPVLRYYAGGLADLRDWLLARLEQATFLTDCELRKDVEAIVVTAPPPSGEEVSYQRLSSTTTTSRALASALIRYVYGCICAALLPPCRTCEDTAVLLATVEVEECDVVYICNLERTIPLTGTALAYWFPVQELARLLDIVCCELPRRIVDTGWKRVPLPRRELREVARPAAAEVPVAPRPTATLFKRTTTVPLRAEPVTNLLETAGVPSTLTARVGRALENVAALEPFRELAAPMLVDVSRKVVAPDVGAALASDAGRAALVDAVREVAPEAVAEPAPKVETARRLAKLEDRLKDVTALKRDVTTLRRRSDDLIAKNTELERRNAALERRLAEIAGGS